MTPIYETNVQASIDAIKRQRERIVSQLLKEFNEKVNQHTSHLDKALEMLYSENEVIGWDKNESEQIEIKENGFRDITKNYLRKKKVRLDGSKQQKKFIQLLCETHSIRSVWNSIPNTARHIYFHEGYWEWDSCEKYYENCRYKEIRL